MPNKMESEPLPPINPLLEALVAAAAEVGNLHKLKIGIINKGQTAQIVVDRTSDPDGSLYLGSALEVLAAAHVIYDRAAAASTTGEIILTVFNARFPEPTTK